MRGFVARNQSCEFVAVVRQALDCRALRVELERSITTNRMGPSGVEVAIDDKYA
jgi:hypothetical protein